MSKIIHSDFDLKDPKCKKCGGKEFGRIMHMDFRDSYTDAFECQGCGWRGSISRKRDRWTMSQNSK